MSEQNQNYSVVEVKKSDTDDFIRNYLKKNDISSVDMIKNLMRTVSFLTGEYISDLDDLSKRIENSELAHPLSISFLFIMKLEKAFLEGEE